MRKNLIKEFPFAFWLFILGFVVGLFLLYFMDFSIDSGGSLNVIENPIVTAVNYIKKSVLLLIQGLAFGVIIGTISGLIGFIIDYIRRHR